MAPKVKVALNAVSEAVETMCGWAFCVVALYALLFMNLTGSGPLWDSLRGVLQNTTVKSPSRGDVTVVMRTVPMRPPDLAAKAQNHMLLLPEAPEKEITVPVVESEQPARLPDQITDAPADAAAGKNWQKHLKGELRTFTVYGQGDQHASVGGAAPASRSGKAAAVAAGPAPTPAAPGSAYRVGVISGEARPGISDHVTNEDSGPSDGVRNFR